MKAKNGTTKNLSPSAQVVEVGLDEVVTTLQSLQKIQTSKAEKILPVAVVQTSKNILKAC